MKRYVISLISVLVVFCIEAKPIKSAIGGRECILTQSNTEPSPFPNGVIPVEYIETTAADQYIDIEYVPIL